MAALIATSLSVAAVQCVGLLVVGRLIFGVHWGDPAGVFLVLTMLLLAYAGAAALVSMRSRTEEQAISLAVSCAACLAVACTRSMWRDRLSVKLIYDHVGLVAVLAEIGVLALFTALLCALALRAYARTVYSPG